MGLLRRGRRSHFIAIDDNAARVRHMRDLGVSAIAPQSREQLVEGLSQASFTTPLEERNSYANGLLVWPEGQGDDDFGQIRHLVLSVEIGRHAREWHQRSPDVSTDVAVARIEGLLAAMATGIKGRRPNEDYEQFFGPDIPKLVESLYRRLLTASS